MAKGITRRESKLAVDSLFIGGNGSFSKIVFEKLVSSTTDTAQVLVKLADANGNGIPSTQVTAFKIYLSDSPNGRGLTGTAPDVALDCPQKGNKLYNYGDSVLYACCSDDVEYQYASQVLVDIVSAAHTEYYVCAVLPTNGKVYVSPLVVAADYGV